MEYMEMPQSNNSRIPPSARTDVSFQSVKLFIEGVQVPFIGLSITTTINNFPMASVSVPPQVGLMEITRFYSPKVHIFFIDPIDGEEKVLFSGVIGSSSYLKSMQGSGYSSISFTCYHKYHPMTDYILDYTSWTVEINSQKGADTGSSLSSDRSISEAMTGIFRDTKLSAGKKEVSLVNIDKARTDNNVASSISAAVLPSFLSDFKSRIIGVPGMILNIWNQCKRSAFWKNSFTDLSTKLYFPLVEEGLFFFQRMVGHFYIEDLMELDRIDPCPFDPSPNDADKPSIIPPSMRTFLRSAVQKDMGIKLIKSIIDFSGEAMDLITLFRKLLYSMEYEMLVLASPVNIPTDVTLDSRGDFINISTLSPADVIIKPQLPLYYSPVCNIIYPAMIEHISINQEDYNIPSRIELANKENAFADSGMNSTFYRAPASIREAIVRASGESTKVLKTDVSSGTSKDTSASNVPNSGLISSIGPAYNKVGKYEQGRGLKNLKMAMPSWLRYYSNSQFNNVDNVSSGEDLYSTINTAVNDFKAGWEARYGIENSDLNPWSPNSGLQEGQRLLISTVDYEYVKTVASSRMGSAVLIFNPYIVPGYPIDILDSTPNHPSFHAYCASVTHNITSNSISTEITFGSATTYTEIANYYMNPVHPWLLANLGLAKTQTLVNQDGANNDAELKADRFYAGALGVKAIAPSSLYNFNTGELKAQYRLNNGLQPGYEGSYTEPNGGEQNPMLTGIGNLSLAYRPIETRVQVETQWNIKFIDMDPGNYNPTVIRYTNTVAIDKSSLEPGQSQWLDYDPMYNDSRTPQQIASWGSNH